LRRKGRKRTDGNNEAIEGVTVSTTAKLVATVLSARVGGEETDHATEDDTLQPVGRVSTNGEG
jgi:hypothetical protein